MFKYTTYDVGRALCLNTINYFLSNSKVHPSKDHEDPEGK